MSNRSAVDVQCDGAQTCVADISSTWMADHSNSLRFWTSIADKGRFWTENADMFSAQLAA
jgi:hypothetical protein